MRPPAPMTLVTTSPTIPAAPPTSTEVVVHVVGEVRKPGVVHAKQGDRVEDAIEAVGGAKTSADLEAINLAAKLEDGAQIYVPPKGTPIRPAPIESTPRPPSTAPATVRPIRSPSAPKPTPVVKASGKVSLNTATAAQLESLPGVGPSTAEKILAYRQEHGGFSSLEEIMSVKGIGPKKFESMRPFLTL